MADTMLGVADFADLSEKQRGRIITQERHKAFMPRMVRRERINPGHNSFEDVLFDKLKVWRMESGAEYGADQEWGHSLQSYSTYIVGGSLWLTRDAIRRSTRPVLSLGTSELSDALEEQQDIDVLALFSELTTWGLGAGTGTTMQPDLVTALWDTLTGNQSYKIPRSGPVVCIIHPYSFRSINATFGYILQGDGKMAAVPEALQTQAIQRGYMGRISNVELYTNGNIPIAGNAGRGAVYHRDSLIYLTEGQMRVEPVNKPEVAGGAIRTIIEKRYGVATVREQWGGYLHVNAQRQTASLIV